MTTTVQGLPARLEAAVGRVPLRRRAWNMPPLLAPSRTSWATHRPALASVRFAGGPRFLSDERAATIVATGISSGSCGPSSSPRCAR